MAFNIFATATSDIPLANLDANFTMIGSSAVASTLYPTATTSITYGTAGTTHYFSGSGLLVGYTSATGSNKLQVTTTTTAYAEGGLSLVTGNGANYVGSNGPRADINVLLSQNWKTNLLFKVNTSDSDTAPVEVGRFDSSGNLLLGGTSNSANARLLSENGAGNQLGLRYTGIATWYNSIDSSGNYIWTKDGSEKARIDSSGNLLVGQTSTGLANSTSYSFELDGQGIRNNHGSGTPTGYAYMQFGLAGTSIGSITQNGSTGVLYNLTSDYRLKNNPQSLTGAREFVMALQPKKWQWWDGSGEGVGFVAHEFMEVAKYSGHGTKDAVDTDGKPIMQSIQPSSSEVMANLVSLIQEQQALITQLTARITALETA